MSGVAGGGSGGLEREPPWLQEESLRTVEMILRGHRQAFGRPLLAGLEATDLEAAGHEAASHAAASLKQMGREEAGPETIEGKEADLKKAFASGGGERRRWAQELFAGPLVVLAHDGGADPRLIWASAAALRLWRRPWAAMIGLPSRLTAEPAERRERAEALARARQQQALQGYSGIRIDSRGRRFRIAGARLWTLRNAGGQTCGQAAGFADWWWL